jgi:hypothetical protein
VRRLVTALLMIAVLAAYASAAAPAPPVVRLAELPHTLVAGQRWVARLTVRPAARPTLSAASGRRTVTVRTRASGSGRYTAVVRLPAPGIWRLAAVVRRRSFPLGRVRVLRSYPLALPAQILALDDRSLLVVERLGRDRILRVDAATGRFSVATKRIPSPWGLARAADGRILVSGEGGVYELGGRKIADVAAGPIARAPQGGLYFAEQTSVGSAAAETSRRSRPTSPRRTASSSAATARSSSATAATAGCSASIPRRGQRRSSLPACGVHSEQSKPQTEACSSSSTTPGGCSESAVASSRAR